MKKLLFAIVMVAFATSLMAQTYQVKVHKNGEVIFNQATSVVDSITFHSGNANFNYNGSSLFQRTFAQIDSVTFYNPNGGGGNTDPDDPDTIPTHDTTEVDHESGIHITWNNGGEVTIVNEYRNQGVDIVADGENVTVTATAGLDDLTYVLDGTAIDGSLQINTDKSLILLMQGLHLHSTTGPALWVVTDHRATIHLAQNTVNFISDTTNISNTSHKAAMQSQGKFEIQGDGSLTVKGYTKHAIQSSGKTAILGGTVTVNGLSTSGDAMNVDDLMMQDGSLTVTSLGDGIDGDQGHIQVSGGAINITCSSSGVEGMACDSTINIAGGEITINMSGADSKGISGNENIFISGGNHNITVSGNQSKGIKAKGAFVFNDGTLTVNANGTYVLTNGDMSYCTGIKADGLVNINGGNVTVTCGTSNNGGKCISADGDININNGTVNLTANGGSGSYTATTGTKSYTTTGLKSNGNVSVNGGTVTMNVGGKGVSADYNYNMTGGQVTITTSTNGAVISGSGTSASDGYCSAGVSVDGNINIYAGTFSCTSTGKGGRGLKADGALNVGVLGASDDLVHIYIKTSGTAVNGSSSGGGFPGGGSSSDYWKGLPKGVKCAGNIVVNSGHVNSFCAQTSGDPSGEAIESKDSIIINGGYVEANAYDDAINAANFIKITGGYVWAYARGNDAIDCNGAENSSSSQWGGSSNSVNTINITGGTVIASGTEVAVDDCGDRGGYISASNCTFVLIGGNMGICEATPQLTGQKFINISSSSSGGGYPGGGGGGGLSTAQSGFTVKNSSGTEIMTFKWPTISTGQSGFEDTTAGAKPGPGGSSSSGIYITTPNVQSGTYTVYNSPTITGGTSWHGLYSGATSTGGTSSTVSAQ